jgi:hypothetical protein
LKGELSALEQVTIQRRASYLYARAYLKLVVALTVVYAAVCAGLGIVSELTIDNMFAGILIITLGAAPIILLWLVYLLILWAFKRESKNAVDIRADGIREMRDGREHAFIPWEGIKEIELAATVIAGASLRVKGAFADTTISNVDLVITEPLGIREMHRALGKTREIGHLFADLKAAAPQATVKLNKLARLHQDKYEWADDRAASRRAEREGGKGERGKG